MALQKEIWISDIQENLFPTSSFITRSVNHSAWVANKTVHVPQAGANPAVAKNRSVLPATISQRTDTELTYSLAEYTTDPFLLTNIEELQISYDKRASLLMSQVETLREVIGNNTAYAWAPSDVSRMVRTTGLPSTGALASGVTSGSRSAVTIADIAKVRAILDNDNVPAEGRILLVPADIYNSQLLDIAEIKQAQMYGSANLPSGVVSKVLGFEIMIRPNVVVYGTGATPVIKTVDATGTPSASTNLDNLGILAFHPNYVATALGETKIFYDEDKPEYYGSLFSALVMHGATKLRSDSKGIAAIIQQ